MELTFIDYVVFMIYLIILYGLVYYKYKKVEVDDFLISKRNLNVVENTASINASKTGGILIGYTALVYLYNIAAIWYFIGMALGYLIFIPFGIKLYKMQKQKYYTLGDYFYKNYGKFLGFFITFLCVLLMFGFLCINLVGAAKVLNLFVSIPYVLCVILIISIVFGYVVTTGFKSVVKTDFIQYLAIFFIVLFFGIYLLFYNIKIIHIFNYSLFNMKIANFVGFFLIGILYPFAQPEIFQRVYASKNSTVFKRSMLCSIFIYFFVALVLTLISLVIVNLYPNLDPDTAFVVGLYNMLPLGINGLLLVVLFAAFMSSLDTYLYTAASSFVQDLFNFDKEKTKKYIRLTIGIISLSAIIVSSLYSEVISLSFIFVGLMMILGLSVILTWINFNISKNILICSSIGGFIILIFSIIFNIINNSLSPGIVICGFLGFLISLLINITFKFVFVKLKTS